MTKTIPIFAILLLAQSCNKKISNTESPYNVAKSYCICVETQLLNAKDSTVDLNDCQTPIFEKSRLLRIYSDHNNENKYSRETLDSAFKFAIEVRNIQDTLCYSKIDFKKVKKRRHI